MEDIAIHFMRDNHTFRRLSLDVEKTLEMLLEEWESGWTYGMIACRHPCSPGYIHAHGNWLTFEAEVRKWYQAFQERIGLQEVDEPLMKSSTKYLVLKHIDIVKYLSDDEEVILDDLRRKINRARLLEGKEIVHGIVVEHDDPRFEQVWQIITAEKGVV